MGGFDTDPDFEIISMPGDAEHGQEATGEMIETEEDLDAQDGSDKAE